MARTREDIVVSQKKRKENKVYPATKKPHLVVRSVSNSLLLYVLASLDFHGLNFHGFTDSQSIFKKQRIYAEVVKLEAANGVLKIAQPIWS